MKTTFKVLYSISIFLFLLGGMSFSRYWIIYKNYNNYNKVDFVIDEIKTNNSDSAKIYFLIGSINRNTEKISLGYTINQTVYDNYPKGKTIKVWWNPNESDLTIQGASLRLILDEDFKPKQSIYFSAKNTTLVSAIPLFLVIVLHILCLRIIKKRKRLTIRST